MKTAKEITEYLEKEWASNEDAHIHLVYVQHEQFYWQKIEALKHIRKWFLESEYFGNNAEIMEGIKLALMWVLKDKNVHE